MDAKTFFQKGIEDNNYQGISLKGNITQFVENGILNNKEGISNF